MKRQQDVGLNLGSSVGDVGMGMQGWGWRWRDGDEGRGMQRMGTVSHFSSARLSCLGEGWGECAVGVGEKRGKGY